MNTAAAATSTTYTVRFSTFRGHGETNVQATSETEAIAILEARYAPGMVRIVQAYPAA